MNSNSFVSVIVVLILVLLVGFGVWYATMLGTPEDTGTKIEVDLGSGGAQ